MVLDKQKQQQQQQTNKLTNNQGRLSLSTDGDKCTMVNFGGGEWKINFGREWKSLILKVWILCTNLIINNLQFTVSEI